MVYFGYIGTGGKVKEELAEQSVTTQPIFDFLQKTYEPLVEQPIERKERKIRVTINVIGNRTVKTISDIESVVGHDCIIKYKTSDLTELLNQSGVPPFAQVRDLLDGPGGYVGRNQFVSTLKKSKNGFQKVVDYCNQKLD